MNAAKTMTGEKRPCNALTFADGTSWTIEGKGVAGTDLARSFARSMRLTPSIAPPLRHLCITQTNSLADEQFDLPLIFKHGNTANQSNTVIYRHPLPRNNLDTVAQLMELGLIISSSTEAVGGMLFHGALTVTKNQGVILAGPSDVGKTTATQRLPDTWQSLSDDCTLVVRDNNNNYHAHPWPTWSSLLMQNIKGMSWDVQTSVPLKAICMLTQSEQDNIEVLERGRAVCMLTKIGEQAWRGLHPQYSKTKKIKLRLQRFNNICDLSKSIPSYLLHLSKEGAFWEKIESILD